MRKTFFVGGKRMPTTDKREHARNNLFAIIGTGMVGTAIGILLKRAGYRIVAVYDHSPGACKKAAQYLRTKTVADPAEAVRLAQCILLTTTDDAIASTCQTISRTANVKGKFIYHMSGAGGLDLLDAAAQKGAYVGSIHPLQSFSSLESAVANIPKSYFGITATGKARSQAKKIVSDLKGVPLFISNAQKPLYHAAACFVSNYLVALLNSAEALYRAAGIKEQHARKAYFPLVYGTLKNIEHAGSIGALTGPIARGDVGTVEKHIKTMRKIISRFIPLYSVLGLATVEIAKKKGSLKKTPAKRLTKILKGG